LHVVKQMKWAEDRLTVVEAALAAGKDDVAEKYLREILGEQPGVVRASLGLSRLLRRHGRWTEAMSTVEAALELSPDDVDLVTERQRVLEEQRQSGEAGEHDE